MELLKDPSNDRAVKTLKPPPHRPLSRQLMFPDRLKNKPDWKLLLDHLSKEGRIGKEELTKLVQDCNRIIKNEGNLIYLHDPLTVVGDIHGQYYDFVKMFDVGGNVETTKYLFLGDFVDRGSFSVEVIVLVYAIKINYPNTVFFLRGNHECRQLTSFFNFKDECLYKYDQETYDMFMDSFDLFPLACVVNNKFLAIHGGISPDLKTLDDIKKIDRYHEPPRSGLFCDILWSDPIENDQGSLDNGWRGNEVRGCSWFFGNEAANRFLQRNNLISVIRAHEAQLDGYKMHRWNGNQDFPVVITIFSAPNYCDVYKNKGAVIKFENNTLNIQQFKDTPHPYLLPNFMDIFSWSIPFVTEKVTEMLYMILRHEEQDSDDEQVNQQDIEKFKQMAQNEKTKKGESKQLNKQLSRSGKDKLRSRLRFVATMMKMQKTLREENESIVQLKGACPDKRLPRGLLLQGKDAITDALQDFNCMKLADSINEKMPDIHIPQQSIQIKKPGQSSKKKSDFINIQMWNEAVMDILFGSFEDVNEVGNKERINFDVNQALRQFSDILDPDFIGSMRQAGQYEESDDDEEEDEEQSEREQKVVGQLHINEPNISTISIPNDVDQYQYLKSNPQIRTLLRQLDLRNSMQSGQSNNTRQSHQVKYPVYAFSDFYYAATEEVKIIYDRVVNDILYKHKKSKQFDDDYYDSLLQNFSVLTDQQIREHLQQSKDSEIILDSFKKQKNLKSLEKNLALYTRLQNETKENYTILCQEQVYENPFGLMESKQNPLMTAQFYQELDELVNKKHKKIKLQEPLDIKAEIKKLQQVNQNQIHDNGEDAQQNQMELETAIRKNDNDNLNTFFSKKLKVFECEINEQFPQNISRPLNKESFLYQCPIIDVEAVKCQAQLDEPGIGLLQRIQQQLEDEKKQNEQQNQQNQAQEEVFKQQNIDKKEQEFQQALDYYSYYNKEIVDFCLGREDNFLLKPFETYNRVEVDLQNKQFFSEKLEVLLHQKKFPEKQGPSQQLANRLAAPSIVSRQKDNRSAVSNVNLQSMEDQNEESQDLSQFGEDMQQQDLNQQFGNDDIANKELINLIETKMKAFQTSPIYNHSLVAESFLLNDFSQDLSKHAHYHRNNLLDNLYDEKQELLGLAREQVNFFDPVTVEMVPLSNQKENRKDNREFLLEESTEKQNSQEYYKSIESLSLSKGNFILMEYIEQRPVILNNTGMCSKVTRYVYAHRSLSQFNQKRKGDDGDNFNSMVHQFTEQTKQITPEEITLWEFKNMLVESLGKIGQIRFLDRNGTIPLQGQLTEDRIIGIAVIENELYRAPIFKQKLPVTDFLLVRTRDAGCHFKYTLRPIDCIYLVGQIEPKIEIYTPHSRPLGTFLKNCLKTYIKKQFKNDQDVKQDELEIIFQKQSHTNIRSALKECKGVQDSSNQKTWRYQKGDGDQALKYDIIANQVCLYESMLHSSYLLQEFGLRELKNSDKMKKTLQEFLTRHPQDFADWVIARRIEDELNMTAWSLSQSFLHSANQTGRMLLYGIGDPTSGHGGLNYIKKPLKARGEKGQNAILEKKPQVMGTDNDLRKLHVEDIQNISRKLGLTTEPNLKRWRMINKLTAFLQQAQNPDDQSSTNAMMFRKNLELLDEKQRKQLSVIEKYAKNQRLTTKKQKEQYQKELDKQLAILIQNLTLKIQGNYFDEFKVVKDMRIKRKLDKDDKNRDLEYNAQEIEPYLITDQENYKLRIEAFQRKEKKIWLEKKKKKGLQ